MICRIGKDLLKRKPEPIRTEICSGTIDRLMEGFKHPTRDDRDIGQGVLCPPDRVPSDYAPEPVHEGRAIVSQPRRYRKEARPAVHGPSDLR